MFYSAFIRALRSGFLGWISIFQHPTAVPSPALIAWFWVKPSAGFCLTAIRFHSPVHLLDGFLVIFPASSLPVSSLVPLTSVSSDLWEDCQPRKQRKQRAPPHPSSSAESLLIQICFRLHSQSKSFISQSLLIASSVPSLLNSITPVISSHAELRLWLDLLSLERNHLLLFPFWGFLQRKMVRSRMVRRACKWMPSHFLHSQHDFTVVRTRHHNPCYYLRPFSDGHRNSRSLPQPFSSTPTVTPAFQTQSYFNKLKQSIWSVPSMFYIKVQPPKNSFEMLANYLQFRKSQSITLTDPLFTSLSGTFLFITPRTLNSNRWSMVLPNVPPLHPLRSQRSWIHSTLF